MRMVRILCVSLMRSQCDLVERPGSDQVSSLAIGTLADYPPRDNQVVPKRCRISRCVAFLYCQHDQCTLTCLPSYVLPASSPNTRKLLRRQRSTLHLLEDDLSQPLIPCGAPPYLRLLLACRSIFAALGTALLVGAVTIFAWPSPNEPNEPALRMIFVAFASLAITSLPLCFLAVKIWAWVQSAKPSKLLKEVRSWMKWTGRGKEREA